VTQVENGTVYVVDDDDAVRDSLLFLLDVDGLPARGFSGVAEFIAALPRPAIGCVVTDMRMPGLDGLDLLRLLEEHDSLLPAIVITGHHDVESAARVLAAGAFDFIEKPFQDSAILAAIHAAMAIGQPDPVRNARARATVDRIAHLPERERTVLDWLVQGETTRAPAAAQGFAAGDVELLRSRIMHRVGASSLPDLVRLVTEARRYAA
jgi:two-component system response regulator FixJ